MNRLATPIVLVVTSFASSCLATAGPGSAEAPPVAELAERAAWGEPGAREALQGLVAQHPEGPIGDHAALAFAAVLVEEGRGSEALPLLRRSASGAVAPVYARLLLARAVAEGGLRDAVPEARELLHPVLEKADTLALEQEVRFRALQLATRAGAWPEAARQGRELLARTPATGHLDEARWLTAESLRLSGARDEARALYLAIWVESPGSPWALQARDQLVAGGVEIELAPGDRLLWVEALQEQGRHQEALAALRPLLEATAALAFRDQGSFLAARSHFVLRQNQDVVRLATAISRRSPRSPWAAQAAMQAIRALARQGRTGDIREWETWLRAAHPQGDIAHEARYFLGVHLGHEEGEREQEEGLEILREVAASGERRGPDALWRITWIEQGRGRGDAARRALERLVEGFPTSAFRPAALYWLARFQEPPGGPRARALFHTVRRESPRDYYGLLATERLRALGEPLPPLRSSGAPLSFDSLRSPERRPEPAYRRAVELRGLGLLRFAVAELETLPVAQDPPLDLGVIHLLARSGDTWSAIGRLQERYGARLAREPIGSPRAPEPVWEALYPFPYRQAVEEAASRRAPTNLPFDSFLVAAVARNESRFWSRAVSPAGAVGVLQLLPETAARVARRLGMEPPGRGGLLDPGVNVELGTAHLAELVEELGGAWAPALAGYNAGPAAARRWWREHPEGQELDLWIETIPFPETRIYVKRILGDQRLYRALYGPSEPAGP